ncbi:MAG: cytochrome-c peroxidase [Gammaproteobacteria bacterium]|nr:cytochrome-c peroxidase [Gammaproteobacteria bacterium]MCY4164863.1 cytochrome-c peroxidase [Gammaproteobacteria bacterium]MCY4255782.1 cytochrome-c peroxidase [Gammaproteobacteria bacterium]MCY4340033.1 cytochrome-c peroxidase [Gammaproteobacteria bacterium]
MASAAPLGLPELPVPDDNPMTPAKIALGDKLFHDERFSATGEVSCSTCHEREKGFTDSPLSTSEGILGLTGTRNSPTATNAAYFETLFWDGRSPSLEEQAQHPFLNPVEMGLETHDPILEIVAKDPDYVAAFREVFGKEPGQVTINEVTKAIAAFQRTLLFGNSRFDRYWFGGEEDALSEAEIRGLDLFLNEGRCVSCHTIEHDHALFTDHRFHNLGVGINDIQGRIPEAVDSFLAALARGAEVDETVLSEKLSSELGRFAISEMFDDLGAFKTPTLRNVAATAPYMHDGSLATLKEVMDHYNNGGVTEADDPVNDFLSSGIRPLDLTDEQVADLVLFMEALTSPEYEALAEAADASGLD